MKQERASLEENDCTNLGLAGWRRKKSLSLHQIADATKIGVRSLQAIESEEFKKLPGGIYSTSYIRQYARAIDFDLQRSLLMRGPAPTSGPNAMTARLMTFSRSRMRSR